MQGGVFMTAKNSKPRPPRPGRRSAGGKPNLVMVLLCSFGCGVGAALILLAIMAQIFAHTALSLDLVKPFASAAAAIGALISGYVLANGVRQMRLLCGVACGAFYCLCLFCATALRGTVPMIDQRNGTLLAALLLGGTLGGGLSALGAPGSAPQR